MQLADFLCSVTVFAIIGENEGGGQELDSTTQDTSLASQTLFREKVWAHSHTAFVQTHGFFQGVKLIQKNTVCTAKHF